jgi:uncharacterized protein YkwD
MQPAALALAIALALVGSAPPRENRTAPSQPACATDPEASGFLTALGQAREDAGRPSFDWAAVLCAVAQKRAATIARRSPPTTALGDLPAVGADLERAAYRPFAWDLGSFRGPETGATLWRAWRRQQPEFFARVLASDASQAGYARAASPLAGDHGAVHVLIVALPQGEVMRRRMAAYRDLDAVRREILAATNEERAARGLGRLAIDPRLERAAQAHAEGMLTGRFYDHTDPWHRGPRERAREQGLTAASLAENLAKGLFGPREVVANWMGSSGHRDNLLAAQLTRIGIGCAYDASGETEDVLWVQLFSDEPR